MQIVDVPAEFRPKSHRYPFHQRGPQIEEYFDTYARSAATTLPDTITYLPVFWSNVYFERYRRTKDGYKAHQDLQDWLGSVLDPAANYFTVVQCDDGVYEALPPNVCVFGAGGVGDVPIPLTCDLHPVEQHPRTIKAYFIGNMLPGGPRTLFNPKGEQTRSTRYVEGVGTQARRAMWDSLQGLPGYDIRDASHIGKYMDKSVRQFEYLAYRSVFALAPRGYGRTSFRFYEALQLGCIPVYIYADAWLPYAEDWPPELRLNWDDIAVGCHIDQLPGLNHRLDTLIASGAVPRMQAKIAELYDEWFSLAGASKKIMEFFAGFPRD